MRRKKRKIEWVISDGSEDSPQYLEDFVDIPVFGPSPVITDKQEKAKRYTDTAEAMRDARIAFGRHGWSIENVTDKIGGER